MWHFLSDRLRRRSRAVLLYVVESSGQTPGRAGFKMAVAADGGLCGSIGGGRIEADLVERARAMLRQRAPVIEILRRVHQPHHPESSGMICGGEQTVVVMPCRKSDAATLRTLLARREAGRCGILTLSPNGLGYRAARAERPPHQFVRRGGVWSYAGFIAPMETLFIVGGGHVGLALSRVMATLGFRIVVLDERGGLGTLEQNESAHERRVVPFARIGAAVPSGARHYAVIMTPGHASDELVLRQLVRKRLRYLGMLGSRRKVAEIFRRLRDDGVPQEMLDIVRAPVGLPIGSQTPAEIAVSIAAEIIRIRNG
ncbi:MAG: XdhC family protein [Verrucomicrobia bacterium]|nr:XdhC family protein [Verrucomicrobiota bacterium]